MPEFRMLGADEKVAEIRRIYFGTTRETIRQDLERALSRLKSMASEEERERATVYMHGLAEMSKDWFKKAKRGGGKKKR